MKKNITSSDYSSKILPSRKKYSSVRVTAKNEVKYTLSGKMPARLGEKKSAPLVVIAHPSLFTWQR